MKPDSLLNSPKIQQALAAVAEANRDFHRTYPGVLKERQPVHTVYGGAHLFKADIAGSMSRRALEDLRTYAPDAWRFARALQLNGYQRLPGTQREADRLFAGAIDNNEPAWLAANVYQRVQDKLKREPVEDFRIDFEDGFGIRPDKEEDATAKQAAAETARGLKNKTLPPFIGIRIKDFDSAPQRALRTLEIYLGELLSGSGGRLPDNFVVTQPKVFAPQHTACLVDALEELEQRYHLKAGSLRLEIMIELTQSVINTAGAAAVWSFVKAARGRCRGIHFGTYDYTASCDIIAQMQAMDNPACDFAKHVMKVSVMNANIMLSDGATNILPVPVYREPQNSAQVQANLEAVHAAWRLQYQHIFHSLRTGYYQGWDLHPGQLIVRYAACYAFFLQSFEQMRERMENFIAVSAKATAVGNVFDDAATAQGLINFFLKAYNCGAIRRQDITAMGIRLQDLKSRRFPDIVANYKPPKQKRPRS